MSADLDISRRLLQLYLKERDAPCPICRYNLRHLDSCVCPECGATIELRIGSTDLRLGPWLTVLLGTALPLGFTLFLLIMLIVVRLAVNSPFRSEDYTMLIYFGTASIVYGLVMISTVRKRRVFLRRSRIVQHALAIKVILLNLVFAASFYWLAQWM